MPHELKDTLQLPKTDFPMRAGLPQREPARLAHWAKLGLYEAIQAKRVGAPAFVLHDGPPFTNGDVHIGTALNKTLKDLILRYKSMRGFRTPYVPGWDCHGLPIEQAVTRELKAQNRDVPTSELRGLCAAFSDRWIATQTQQFRRLGVLADWAQGYQTKAPAFEADILRIFATFIEQGLVYRSKKPVYWSIPFETALAEAEIEYQDHTSLSVWVRFPVPVEQAEKFQLPSDRPLSLVIWTTTPWTLPANLAIALHPDLDYVVAEVGAERIIVAQARLAEMAAAAKLAEPPVVRATVPGKALAGLLTRHPFLDRNSPVVLAEYVTTETGTGAVHIAPGHGMDDYLTGLKNGLEIYNPVGPDGRYLDDGRIPSDLVGLTTLQTVADLEAKKLSPADSAVLRKLDAAGALWAKQRYVHSYPHCWRSKTPIIFRAVDQWFVALDQPEAGGGGSARDHALAAIEQVRWIPAWGQARIHGAVAGRPDWCVSRQRSWGVPIPAFYDAQKRPYLDAGVVRAIADQVAVRGTNLWYESTPAELLAGVALPAGWPAAAELTAGRDTLDVWLDSGSSHAAVLARSQGGTHWPAELYLEGSDQHRGWFQSSLWTSVISRGRAPYAAVLTHGFIVDEERKKISKSSSYQKPQTSDAYIAEYGADVIRLWISSQDFRDDIPISKEILSHVGETYRLFRNSFRFQLANLFDFEPAADAVPLAQLDTLDRWALHQTSALIAGCTAAYEAYEFHRVYQLCNQFCAVTLSATYHDVVKDRLYTLGTHHPLRRSSQTAMHLIFDALTRVLAPILTFTADEAWSFGTARTEYAPGSVHLQDWPVAPAAWTQPELEAEVATLLRVRAQVNEAIEPLRAAGQLGKSLDAAVVLSVPSDDPLFRLLEKHRDFLPELFIVSHVSLTAGVPSAAAASDRDAGLPLVVAVRPSSEGGSVRCPRCWRWLPPADLAPTDHGELCSRCREALKS